MGLITEENFSDGKSRYELNQHITSPFACIAANHDLPTVARQRN